MAKEAGGEKSFRAKIQAIGPGGAWSQLIVPFNVEKEWGSRARVSVAGTMNGFAFRTSIFPDGKGRHTMMVNKAMKIGARARAGDTVQITVAQDTKPRVVAVPKDFKAALARSVKAAKVFEGFSPSHRVAYVDWITQAKREETRAARIGKAIEMIAAGKKRT
jgi:Bacteriocin-protection, YdeI or OmpD-Associated/Domain of unknown function (DUF1905)